MSDTTKRTEPSPKHTTAQNEWVDELKKCIASPYYFVKNFITINGKPYETALSEEEFNESFKKHL